MATNETMKAATETAELLKQLGEEKQKNTRLTALVAAMERGTVLARCACGVIATVVHGREVSQHYDVDDNECIAGGRPWRDVAALPASDKQTNRLPEGR